MKLTTIFAVPKLEVNDRLKAIWTEHLAHEIEHVKICSDLLMKYEKKDFKDLMKTDRIEPLIVFEPNKDYVNKVLQEQVNLRPYNMKFVAEEKLPSNWKSFEYQSKVNTGGAPSDIVEEKSKVH
jgi:hypothetical protein